MARPFDEPHAACDSAGDHVDGDELGTAGVGDEGVPAVGVRRRVARFLELTKDVALCERRAVEDGDGAVRGMRDDGMATR